MEEERREQVKNGRGEKGTSEEWKRREGNK